MAHEATVGISIEFGLWIIWIIWQAIESTSLVGRPLVYLSDATAMKIMNGDEWRQITKDLNTLMPLHGHGHLSTSYVDVHREIPGN